MFQNNKFDFQGWFDAYAQYFGTKENPVKPCRSTIGIATLVQPDKFIEIELVAVYWVNIPDQFNIMWPNYFISVLIFNQSMYKIA